MTPILPDKILATIREVLEWCRTKSSMRIPGEGGERAFRGRLTEALIEKVLGWPAEFILSGERFDISLLNTDEQPIVTIETKEPGHITTELEYKIFLGRLKRYPSLRFAYITNGSYWERFDLLAQVDSNDEITPDLFEDVSVGTSTVLFADTSSKRKIGRRLEFALGSAVSSEATEFFGPLEAARYHDLQKPLPVGQIRHKLTRE